jgi:hypothetical protein
VKQHGNISDLKIFSEAEIMLINIHNFGKQRGLQSKILINGRVL